jgi:hypothetical protein
VVVLVSFVLVLAAAVTLVIGLLQTGLTLIWLSIGCSVVAGLVLALAVVRGRPEGKARVEPPRPVPAPSPSRSVAPSYEPAGAGGEPDWRPAAEESPAPWRQASETEAEEEPAPAPPPRRRYGKPAAVDLTEEIPAVGKADLPIPDYDTLRATEIINRLDGLDASQLEALRAHEAAGKGRTSVLARIDARLEAVQAPGWEVEEEDWEAAPAEAEAEIDEDEDVEIEAEAEAEPDEEPEPEEEIVEEELVEAVVAEEPEPEEEPAEADEGFPIANYDKLRVGQILPILRTLEPDELTMVREREEEGQARAGVLDRIDSLSGAPKPAKAAPVKKAPPAKKAAAPVKKAAPAKKAPAAAKRPAAATSTMTPMQAAIAAAKAKKGL